MKKIIPILLVMSFLFSFAACKKNVENDNDNFTNDEKTQKGTSSDYEPIISVDCYETQNEIEESSKSVVTKPQSDNTTAVKVTTVPADKPTEAQTTTLASEPATNLVTEATEETQAVKYAAEKDKKLLVDLLIEALNNHNNAIRTLTEYIKNPSDELNIKFYGYINAEYDILEKAYNMSLEFEDMNSMSDYFKKAMDILEKIKTGRYSTDELTDMLKESFEYLRKVADICKEKGFV